MEQSKILTIEVLVDETSDRTDAKAVMVLRDARFIGWGRARRNPTDPNVPMIGGCSRQRGGGSFGAESETCAPPAHEVAHVL